MLKKLSLIIASFVLAGMMASCADNNYTTLTINVVYKDKPVANAKVEVSISAKDKSQTDTTIGDKITKAIEAGKISETEASEISKGCSALQTDEKGVVICHLNNKALEDVYVPSLYDISASITYGTPPDDITLEAKKEAANVTSETDFTLTLKEKVAP